MLTSEILSGSFLDNLEWHLKTIKPNYGSRNFFFFCNCITQFCKGKVFSKCENDKP